MPAICHQLAQDARQGLQILVLELMDGLAQWAAMNRERSEPIELERGNLLKRVRNYIPILIPLIVNAIRRSLELAESMESRAWGASAKRTNLYSLKLKRKDYLLVVISIIMLVIAVYVWLNVSIPSIASLISI